MDLNIEVYSDVICPWCFLGKHRLEKALEFLDKPAGIQVSYLPFELNPFTPPEGPDRETYPEARREPSLREAHQRLEAMGKEAGIPFDFERIRFIPNTFNAHRVIWLAGVEDVQAEVVEALFAAYFLEGRDLGKAKVLAAAADGAGLSGGKVEKLLKGDEGSAEVRELEKKGYRMGIAGVPYFVIGGNATLSGAQPVETFVSVISKEMEK
jgi:predicted DsbA family dithiol-disulfide isomerase